MPDITYLYTAATGAPVASDGVNNNTYNAASSSLRVINGYLDNANRAAGWAIRADQVRNRSMGNGQMVGATGNLDYSKQAFPLTNVDSGAYVPVPGCGVSFYLPVEPSFLVITWQLVAANDAGFNLTNVSELRLLVDGERQSSHFRQVPDSARASTPPVRFPQFDRAWSGHWSSAQPGAPTMSKGWHSASVVLFGSCPTTRIRVRNMKYFWLK